MIMKKMFAAAAAVLAMASCNPNKSNPLLADWATPYGMPPFEIISYSDYVPAVKEAISLHDAEIQAILDNQAAPDFANTVEAFEFAGNKLSQVLGVLYNLSESDATDEMNKIMEEVSPLLSEHDDNIYMNSKLYERVKAVYDADQSALTAEQKTVLKKLYEAFTRNGVGLDEEAQAKLREINKTLSADSQKFGQFILNENNAFKDKFGVPLSSYTDEMTSNPDRKLREDMFKAYSSRGNNGDENDTKALCVEILKLRAQKAKILGFDNFAAYQLDNKMAKTPETVDAFLAQIIAPSVARAKEEVADMQKIMNEDIAAGLLPEGSRIEPWDWFYYAEKVRKAKYDLNEDLTRPYFKLENVRDGVFAAAHKVYGINIVKEEDVPVYNPEVETFKVTDADGSLLGIFMTDYLPRSTKRGGAWMSNFREQYIGPDGVDVRPIIQNVCSFTPATDSLPSLLSVDEVSTAFHEFGHALHGLLTKCRYESVSGTNVARDFVETFSQFNENWAFQPEILALYAKHYETGEVIPAELVEKIKNSSKFNQGFMTSELCAASILDMKLHELGESDFENFDIAAFEDKVCADMGLISEIIPRYRTTYFNHIFNSGYSAGYYSYLWAEVLDKDAFEFFESKGIYNPEVADSFRANLLEKGGSEEPMTLYVRFRGQEPDPKALLRGRGLL